MGQVSSLPAALGKGALMAAMRDDPQDAGRIGGSDDAVHGIAAAMDYLRGLELLEQRFGPEHPKVALCLDGIACLCRDQGQLAEAETLYRRALAILERSVGPNDPDTASILENLTIVLYESGREDEARELFDRAKAARDAQARLDRLSRDEA